MDLVTSIAELLRGYSVACSKDVKKVIADQALIKVIQSYIAADVDLLMAGQPMRGGESIVPGMRKHDQIWCAAVDACKAELTEEDYVFLRDEFKARMVTCDPSAWKIAFPDYTPKG